MASETDKQAPVQWQRSLESDIARFFFEVSFSGGDFVFCANSGLIGIIRKLYSRKKSRWSEVFPFVLIERLLANLVSYYIKAIEKIIVKSIEAIPNLKMPIKTLHDRFYKCLFSLNIYFFFKAMVKDACLTKVLASGFDYS